MFATFVPFCFSIIVISLFLTKLVHLSIHANTVPTVAFILFLPSLLFPDVLVVCLSRLALRRKNSVVANVSCLLGCILALTLFGAASSQLGFFYETGNEIKWTDARRYAHDRDGMKVLLSGMNTVMGFGFVIVVISWFAKRYLYKAVGALLVKLGAPITHVSQLYTSSGAHCYRHYIQYPESCLNHCDSDSLFNDDDDLEGRSHFALRKIQKDSPVPNSSWVTSMTILFLVLTTVYRPTAPYSMMSTTLPLAMLEIFQATPSMCNDQAALNGNPWPFPHLIEEWRWKSPQGHFKGWAPGSNSDYAQRYRKTIPGWLPEVIPAGFSKWASRNLTRDGAEETGDNDSQGCLDAEVDGTFYNPVSDPLKITNHDSDILGTLHDAFNNGAVKIRHVVLIMLESYRQELFPLQEGSDIHKIIMESHKSRDDDEISARLSQLCPIAERITGISGNFQKKDGSDFDHLSTREWNDTTQDGFGGINVVGGLTTASLSFKSMASIHCGVWPMTVDNFEESEAQSYQPCIPQVLNLFNQLKQGTSTDDFLEQQWLPAFFQSITDRYDRQEKFDKMIGFKHIVTKDRLDQDAKRADDLEKINYFGYPETTLRSHIEDYIKQAQDERKRMFLSHFTSTTHHPWGVPSAFKSTEFLDTHGKMGWHKDFNSYLNSIRFTDAWLGELLQIFDDFGISNETLIVFVGDHGQAFKEDIFSKTGTYQNGHISNFRVPITFRHPNIPRIQYHANVTSLSVLPTILDLLVSTGSLNKNDTAVASDLIQDYEGQSLIRPYKASDDGRRAWNFGIINSGASMLSLTSADTPWRIVMPLDQRSQYSFTDLDDDPLELKPLKKWSMKELAEEVRSNHGDDASRWALEAEAVARWWALERKRLWGYNPGDYAKGKEED